MTLLHSVKTALTSLAGLLAVSTVHADPLNVLFITVDDFRPELPVYGATHVSTPAIDQLCAEAVTFRRAYVQQAVCQPSRASVLTGARPDTTQIYDVFGGGWPTFRDTMGNVDTLPAVFKNNGYWTAGYGKNFHHADAPSWNVSNSFYNSIDLYQTDANRAVATNVNLRPAWEAYPNDREGQSMDAQVADAAIAAIHARALDGQRFFISAGFWKPHLPFSAPQKYWDLYNRNTLPIAEGRDALPPEGALPASFYDPFSGELTTYKGGRPPFVAKTAATQAALDNGTFTTNQQTGDDWGIITVEGTHIYPEDYARALTHGYYASTSFIDAQIGRILEALDDPNQDGNTSDSLRDSTIIVLWGDHGMHVGRHGSWPKHTNMDVATRIPLIIHHPGMPADSQGTLSGALVEGVDLMPTLLELANLQAPSTHDLEGVSLVPLLQDPDLTWKSAAFSQYPRQVGDVWYMGYAMHTVRYSYVQWREMISTDTNAISLAQRNFTTVNTPVYEELYDLVADPTQRINLSGQPGMNPVLDALGGVLQTALATQHENTQTVGESVPAAPEALAVSFHGGTDAGDLLTAHYLFADANGDAEQGTQIAWIRSDSFNGPGTVVGTSSTYTLQAGDAGMYIRLRITPGADSAPLQGSGTVSDTAVLVGTGFTRGEDLPAPESAVYEGFGYAAGTINSTSTGGRGWSGGWYGNPDLSWGGNSGSIAVDSPIATTPSGYHLSPQGRAAGNGANANNPFRGLAAAHELDFGQDGERFFSHLYRQDGSNAKFELRFHDGSTEIAKVQISNDGGLDLITLGPNLFDAVTVANNTDLLILGRIVTRASGQDLLQISAYPAGSTVPDTPPVFDATVSFDTSAVVDRLFMGIPFNHTNTGHVFWDEFHMDTQYAAVVGRETASPVSPPTVVETFAYSSGNLNSANAGGSGWAGAWYGNRDLSWGGNSGAVVASKTWALPDGYQYIPEGNSGTEGANANTPYRGLTPSTSIDLNSDTVYFSFLFHYDGTGGKFEFGLENAGGELFKLQIKNTGVLGLSGNTFQEPGFTFTPNTDYLVIGKVTASASGSDRLEVAAYPSTGSVPTSEPAFAISSTLTSSATIDRIKFGVAASTLAGGLFWDELRMGPTWGSVVGQSSGVSPIRILPLGDSITYGLSFGQPNGQIAFPYGYRGALQNLLQQRMEFVNRFEFLGTLPSLNASSSYDASVAADNTLRYDGDHEGHSGYTAARTFGSSPGNLLSVLNANYTSATFTPDIVLLHAGINDLIAQNGTAEDLQTDYRALLTKIFDLKPDVDLYVSTLMMNHPNHANYAQLGLFNTWLSTTEVPYWQSQGRQITLVDLQAALEGPGYSSTLPSTNPNYGSVEAPNDRVHPNATGYATIAAAWNAALSLPADAPERDATYADWAAAVWALEASGPDLPEAQPAYSPAGTSLTNLEIFSFGGTPAQLPMSPAVALEGSHPALHFRRRIGTSPAPVIRYATQLINPDWTSTGLVPVSVTPLPDGISEDVILRTPYTLTEKPTQFLSIEVTAPAAE